MIQILKFHKFFNQALKSLLLLMGNIFLFSDPVPRELNQS